jgi:hypothetical protein
MFEKKAFAGFSSCDAIRKARMKYQNNSVLGPRGSPMHSCNDGMKVKPRKPGQRLTEAEMAAKLTRTNCLTA